MDDWLRSDAIEGADMMLYGVSLAYKESSNCRLEANYAYQQELDMIPLMVTQGTRLPLLPLFQAFEVILWSDRCMLVSCRLLREWLARPHPRYAALVSLLGCCSG